MAPELAAQFRAMLTPTNIGIFVGTLAAWAVSQAFGVGEAADILMCVAGVIFLGVGALKAGEDLGDCLMTTMHAERSADLDVAADYLAQSIAILGVVALFALIMRVGAKFGREAPPQEGNATTVAVETPRELSVSAPTAAQDSPYTGSAFVSAVDRPVYRVDGRLPDAIFREGFQPRGTSTDLKSYVDTNNASAFVGTSKTPAIANNPYFAKPGTYLYEVDGAQVKGIDVNSAYPDNLTPHESEIAVVGGVPPEAIISAKPILPGGGLGPTIPNPGYKGGS